MLEKHQSRVGVLLGHKGENCSEVGTRVPQGAPIIAKNPRAVTPEDDKMINVGETTKEKQ